MKIIDTIPFYSTLCESFKINIKIVAEKKDPSLKCWNISDIVIFMLKFRECLININLLDPKKRLRDENYINNKNQTLVTQLEGPQKIKKKLFKPLATNILLDFLQLQK